MRIINKKKINRKKRTWTFDSKSYWVYSSTRHTYKRNLPSACLILRGFLLFIIISTNYYISQNIIIIYIYIYDYIYIFFFYNINIFCTKFLIFILLKIKIIGLNMHFFNRLKSRATSTTRTIFRLNPNQGHAYEDYLLPFLDLIT